MRTHELRQIWYSKSRDFYLGFGAGIVCTAILAAVLASQQVLTPVQTNTVAQTNATQQGDIASRLDAAKQQGIDIGKQQAAELIGAQGSNQVWVYIPAGFTLTEVANLCMAAGVCQDGNALIGQAQQSGVLIRSGSFALPIKGDAQQILQIISTK